MNFDGQINLCLNRNIFSRALNLRFLVINRLTCVAEKFHGSSYQVSSQTGFWPSDFMHGWIFYAVWQVLYTIIMDGVLRRKLKEDPDMVNSIRWLLRDQNGMAFKSVSMVGNYIGIRYSFHSVTLKI